VIVLTVRLNNVAGYSRRQPASEKCPIRKRRVSFVVIIATFLAACVVMWFRAVVFERQLVTCLGQGRVTIRYNVLGYVLSLAFVDANKPATADDLQFLARLSLLRYLYLQECRLSDDDLDTLSNCSSLRHLVITSDKISQQAIWRLAQQLPACTIVLQRPGEGVVLTVSPRSI